MKLNISNISFGDDFANPPASKNDLEQGPDLNMNH